jgi:hypothetical protein
VAHEVTHGASRSPARSASRAGQRPVWTVKLSYQTPIRVVPLAAAALGWPLKIPFLHYAGVQALGPAAAVGVGVAVRGFYWLGALTWQAIWQSSANEPARDALGDALKDCAEPEKPDRCQEAKNLKRAAKQVVRSFHPAKCWDWMDESDLEARALAWLNLALARQHELETCYGGNPTDDTHGPEITLAISHYLECLRLLRGKVAL